MFDPETYAKTNDLVAQDAAKFIPRMIKEMKWTQGDKVLDFGCGAGNVGYNYILPQVEKWDGTLCSLDISSKMLEYAKKTYPHPRIKYICADIFAGDDQNNDEILFNFNNIISNYVFHQIREIRKLLLRLHSILLPGGSMGFIFLTNKNWYFQALQRLGQMDKWKPYFEGYEHIVADWTVYNGKINGEEKFKGLMQDCGFTVKILEIVERTFFYEDIEVVLDLWSSVNIFLHRLSEKMQNELREDNRKLITEFAGVSLHSKSLLMEYEIVYGVVDKPLNL
ncbi:unnamed protein product [Orchesella dallaii]|uniref:Methyltransferase type 12 domain-containing protein n=1 Tax=Orchesella dallaii TaxID=48710 RepID=A0ABP1QP56_9HEXA